MATTRLAQIGIGVKPYGAFQAKGAAPIVVVDTSPAAGGPARRRRRYIFPDGTQVYATHDEALEILQRFARAADAPKPKKAARRSSVRLPMQEIERIQWKRADDTAGELLMPILPNRIFWKPDPTQLAEAVMRLRRKRDDEEAIIALLA